LLILCAKIADRKTGLPKELVRHLGEFLVK
jgi:hypothetical protein